MLLLILQFLLCGFVLIASAPFICEPVLKVRVLPSCLAIDAESVSMESENCGHTGLLPGIATWFSPSCSLNVRFLP